MTPESSRPPEAGLTQADGNTGHFRTNLSIVMFTASATFVVAQTGAETFNKVAYGLAAAHGIVHLVHRFAFRRDPAALPYQFRRVAERYLDPRAITHFDLYAYWFAASLIARHL